MHDSIHHPMSEDMGTAKRPTLLHQNEIPVGICVMTGVDLPRAQTVHLLHEGALHGVIVPIDNLHLHVYFSKIP
jgi:hypothetical protein